MKQHSSHIRLRGVARQDPAFALLLLPAYQEALGAVASYTYRSLLSGERSQELSTLFDRLATDALEQFQTLGELIVALGGNPVIYTPPGSEAAVLLRVYSTGVPSIVTSASMLYCRSRFTSALSSASMILKKVVFPLPLMPVRMFTSGFRCSHLRFTFPQMFRNSMRSILFAFMSLSSAGKVAPLPHNKSNKFIPSRQFKLSRI